MGEENILKREKTLEKFFKIYPKIIISIKVGIIETKHFISMKSDLSPEEYDNSVYKSVAAMISRYVSNDMAHVAYDELYNLLEDYILGVKNKSYKSPSFSISKFVNSINNMRVFVTNKKGLIVPIMKNKISECNSIEHAIEKLCLGITNILIQLTPLFETKDGGEFTLTMQKEHILILKKTLSWKDGWWVEK